MKGLAATYSRGSYTTTTIGKTVFDGRVRNGNGSDHSFMATKIIEATNGRAGGSNLNGAKLLKNMPGRTGHSLKTIHRTNITSLQFAS